MRRLALALVTAIVALAAPAAAQAGGAIDLDAVHRIDAVPAGGVAVEFASDPATCAPVGRCGLRGVVVLRPEPGGLLVRRRGAPAGLEFAFFGSGFGQATVTARVRRTTPSGPRTCVDLRETSFGGPLRADAGARAVLEAVLGTGATRCAGPVLDDLLAVLPSPELPGGALRGAGATLDLRRDATFTAAGLTGTVRSTLVVRLGRRRASDGSGDRRPPRGPRVRRVRTTYRVAAVEGAIRSELRPRTDPAICGPLDACGLRGGFTFTPQGAPQRAPVTFEASAPASRPARDLRTAVTGAGSGRLRGVRSWGAGDWSQPGRIASDITREGAATACRDEGPSGDASVWLERRGRTVQVAYDVDGRPSRCGGPRIDATFSACSLRALGTIPLRAMRGRTVRIPLTLPATRSDEVLPLRHRPRLTLVLRRVRTVERVRREPYWAPGDL